MDLDDDEGFISYGTSLPEIEEEHVLRKKAARELEVRDEKGRQRFHGAFTGGFSAGYFNTVGTKEGWAPSTFVSSRDNKVSDKKYHRPEDFMDEEDFGEFGIATRRIHTTSQFQVSSDSTQNKRKFSAVDSIIPGEAPLRELVKPVSDSIGIKILNKLGWKQGQGIGPRVKKETSHLKVYGCSLPDLSENQEDDPFSLSFTFAPKDVQAETYKPKDDVFGLGYSGLSKDSVLTARISSDNASTTKSWLKKDKKKLTISGQAFGVGAFEDDDDDIYSKDDMTQYDFSELKPVEPKDIRNKLQMGSMCTALAGFCLSSEPPPVKKTYPPPELPRNYNPNRLKAPKAPPQVPPSREFVPRHAMSAEDRSLVLGERKFQPFKLNSSKPPIAELPQPSVGTSSNASRSFRPFPNDETKQRRYEAYLKVKETGEFDKLIQPPTMTEWEKQQEMEEFARAAVLFKPLSAALSSRFESRSSLSVEHEVMDALEKSRKGSDKKAVEKRKLIGKHNRQTLEWHPSSLLCKRFNVANPYPDSSDAPAPQRTKFLFEHMTFPGEEKNVKEETKHVTSSTVPRCDESKMSSEKSYENVEVNKALTGVNEVPKSTNSKDQELPSQTAESTRPPIDFFKDIFENSSSEDEAESTATEKLPEENSVPLSHDDKDVKQQENDLDLVEVVNPDSTGEISEPISPKRKASETKKPGFGVFANLDLDALNQRPLKPKTDVLGNSNSRWDSSVPVEKVVAMEEESVPTTSSETVQQDSDMPVDLYGPDLPPDYCDDSDVKIIPFEVPKHTKHKAKHKHKHHKHKSKKKRKKKSSKRSSDDSSLDSDSEIPHEVIIEKLKKIQKLLK